MSQLTPRTKRTEPQTKPAAKTATTWGFSTSLLPCSVITLSRPDDLAATVETETTITRAGAFSAWRPVISPYVETMVGCFDFPGEETFSPPADVVRAGVVVIAVPQLFIHLTVFAGAPQDAELARDMSTVFAVWHLEPQALRAGPEPKVTGVSELDAVLTIAFAVVGMGPGPAEHTGDNHEE